jgi:hypothetical protein
MARMAGMAGMAERQKEWQNDKMAESGYIRTIMVHANTMAEWHVEWWNGRLAGMVEWREWREWQEWWSSRSIYYGVVDEMMEWAEWRNERHGRNGRNERNGGMVELAEWQNGGMAEWLNGGNGRNSGNEGRNHECWYVRKNGTMAEWQKWKPKYY